MYIARAPIASLCSKDGSIHDRYTKYHDRYTKYLVLWVESTFRAFFSLNSSIFLPSLANRQKICREENSEMPSTGLLSYRYNWYFCAEFDGLIFQSQLLYPIYHSSRYALDIVIFCMSFWDFDFDLCQSYHNMIVANPIIISGKSWYPVTL